MAKEYEVQKVNNSDVLKRKRAVSNLAEGCAQTIELVTVYSLGDLFDVLKKFYSGDCGHKKTAVLKKARPHDPNLLNLTRPHDPNLLNLRIIPCNSTKFHEILDRFHRIMRSFHGNIMLP